jgi:oxygen-dependent protoporphyrinogen oxidase
VTRVAVVGGGISGLTAAYDLLRAGADVVVYEADDRLGGKIESKPFGGLPAVDCGADAFLARVPAAAELCRDLGFRDELISPANGSAFIWSRGALRRVPTPNFLGVPLDIDTLAASGIVSEEGVARAALDMTRVADDALPVGDESVGALVRRRMGDEVLERLVDPLLGGIYAGDADRLSLEAGAPQVAAAARADASLSRGLDALRRASIVDPHTPVFYAPPDGMSRLVQELAVRLGERVHRGHRVARLERGLRGWSVDGTMHDSVVLATPSFVTAELVRDEAPRTARALDGIEYAGVVLVTFAFPRDGVGRPLDASGFLVPKTEGRLLTACSWSSSKWAHLDRGEHTIVRASAGHFGNERALALGDDALIRAMVEELAEMMAVRAQPIDARISRWPRAFPQYTPGHLDRIAALDATLATEAPGIALAGAAYRGIGIPACINQAHAAAAAATA